MHSVPYPLLPPLSRVSLILPSPLSLSLCCSHTISTRTHPHPPTLTGREHEDNQQENQSVLEKSIHLSPYLFSTNVFSTDTDAPIIAITTPKTVMPLFRSTSLFTACVSTISPLLILAAMVLIKINAGKI